MYKQIKEYFNRKEEDITYLEQLEISLERVRREIIGLNDYVTKLDVEKQSPYMELIWNLKRAKEDLKKRIEKENGKE